MDTKTIEAVISAVTIEAKAEGNKIEAVIGEAAKMDVQQAVNYIQSGKAEIDAAVDARLAEIDAEGQEYVDLAKDWAIKTDGTVDGVDYSSKYYAQSILPIASDITTVAGIASDVSAVGGAVSEVVAVAGDLTNIDAVNSNKTNIDTVAGISSDVSTVSGISADVSAVSANSTNINTVAGISSDVTTTAGIASDISSVAGNATDISAVANDLTNIDSVAGDLSNIDAVNANKTNIDAVAGNATNINAVAGDLTNINSVAGDLTNINAVAGDLTNIDAVNSNKTNIDTVASISSDVTTVAGDTANIATVVANMTAINNAPTYANNAEIWAEGTDVQVQALGGEHSAKVWADMAGDLPNNVIDVVATYAALQAYDTTGLRNGSIIKVITDENNSNKTSWYKWTNQGSGGAFVQPVLSADGTIGGDSFAVALSTVYSGRNAWLAFDGVTTQNATWTNVAHSQNVANSYIEFYNPTPICVTKINIWNGNILPLEVDFQCSSDDTNWTTLTSASCPYRVESEGQGKEWSFDVSNTNFYKYYRIVVKSATYGNYATFLEIAITATEGGSYGWVKVNEEGKYATETWVGNQGYLTGSDISNMATTDTAQDITAKKTFLGEKAILFKQTASTDKLGFTLYTSSNSELGAFEYRPNTISGSALLNVNCSYSASAYVGFRYWETAVNIIAPKVATAGNYFIPVNITDGNTTVTAGSNGTVNISSFGYIKGINSSDVTTALGYTPVDPSNLATVATSGSYNDLLNKPTIPAAQVNADWNASSGVAQILNKPTIPTVNNATLTIQKNGTTVKTFTANASSNVTANITVPTNTNELTNGAGFITGISSSDVTTALGYTPAKTDLSNLSSNGKKVLDGQWVFSESTIANGVSCPSTSAGKHTYSLSTYLPSDTSSYEVLFDVVAQTNTTAGKIARIALQTDLMSNYANVCYARTTSGTYYTTGGSSFILPIGTGRSLIDGYWSDNSGTYTLRALAYRRIGSNS